MPAVYQTCLVIGLWIGFAGGAPAAADGSLAERRQSCFDEARRQVITLERSGTSVLKRLQERRQSYIRDCMERDVAQSATQEAIVPASLAAPMPVAEAVPPTAAPDRSAAPSPRTMPERPVPATNAASKPRAKPIRIGVPNARPAPVRTAAKPRHAPVVRHRPADLRTIRHAAHPVQPRHAPRRLAAKPPTRAKVAIAPKAAPAVARKTGAARRYVATSPLRSKPSRSAAFGQGKPAAQSRPSRPKAAPPVGTNLASRTKAPVLAKPTRLAAPAAPRKG